MSFSLSASIVVFDSDRVLLRRTLESLAAAVTHAANAGLLTTARITIVDNDAAASVMVDETYVQGFGAPAARPSGGASPDRATSASGAATTWFCATATLLVPTCTWCSIPTRCWPPMR